MEEEMKNKNYFEILNEINVTNKTENKNGLTYLSWAWAWAELKKIHPTANYKVYETETGINYWNDGRTAWVKTGVTVNDIEHIEYLPIMDFRNKSIALENITSFDVNKAIQRSLTKAVARHGLGLYIYAGEDLPEGEETTNQKETPKKAETKEEINYREELVTYIKSRDLDFNEIAKEHKLNAKSSQDSFKKVLEVLQKDNLKKDLQDTFDKHHNGEGGLD